LARIDGEVRRDEVRVVREFFELTLGTSKAGLEGVRVALKAALQARPCEIDELVKAVRQHVAPADRLKVVDALYDLALVDGPLTQSETNALKRAVTHFNLSEAQLQEITRRRMGLGTAHYATLGVGERATDDELKSAFRKLAAENHPDRVASQGPAQVARAAERFREVKQAYEALRKLRGF
jgi:DnaJ like chaperone protein